MDKENRAIGAVAAIMAYVFSLVVLAQMGLSFGAVNTVVASIGGFLLSVFFGIWVYDLSLDYIANKLSMAGTLAAIVGLLVAFLILPQLSSGFADTLGFGAAQTAEPVPEEPAFPSFMRGTAVDTLSSPQTGINNAVINYYDVEPKAGVASTALYQDNTDSGGSFMTQVNETEGTHLWATASKDNEYYSEKDDGNTGESGSGATNLTLNDYGEGLTKIGSLDYRLMNIENGSGYAENVSLSGSTITLDQGAGPFTFDIIFETDTSNTAIRNILMDIEEGGAYSTVDPNEVEFEIVEAEGVSTSWTAGEPTWTSSITESELEVSGDLEYNNDLAIRVTVGSTSGTGDVIDFDTIDDLFDGTGLEGESGIPEETLTVNVSS